MPAICRKPLHNSVANNGNHDAKRAALDLDLLLILGAPSNHAGRNSTGIWGVNRQGCRFSRPAPWMARGGGPPNHWRITGTPSLSEVPSGGARAFCLLLRFSKVSRRQGGTLGGRYLNNVYVHRPTVSTARPPSQASQLPQLEGCQVDRCRLAGRHGSKLPRHRFSVAPKLCRYLGICRGTPDRNTPRHALPVNFLTSAMLLSYAKSARPESRVQNDKEPPPP